MLPRNDVMTFPHDAVVEYARVALRVGAAREALKDADDETKATVSDPRHAPGDGAGLTRARLSQGREVPTSAAQRSLYVDDGTLQESEKPWLCSPSPALKRLR